MAKVSFTRAELEVVHMCLRLDVGGGDMQACIDHLVEAGDIRADGVTCERIIEKIEEAMP